MILLTSAGPPWSFQSVDHSVQLKVVLLASPGGKVAIKGIICLIEFLLSSQYYKTAKRMTFDCCYLVLLQIFSTQLSSQEIWNVCPILVNEINFNSKLAFLLQTQPQCSLHLSTAKDFSFAVESEVCTQCLLAH